MSEYFKRTDVYPNSQPVLSTQEEIMPDVIDQSKINVGDGTLAPVENHKSILMVFVIFIGLAILLNFTGVKL